MHVHTNQQQVGQLVGWLVFKALSAQIGSCMQVCH